MFIEIKDINSETNGLDLAIIDTESIQEILCKDEDTEQIRHDEDGKVYTYYRITISYKNDGGSTTFCFKSAEQRKATYNALIKALEVKPLILEAVEPIFPTESSILKPLSDY